MKLVEKYRPNRIDDVIGQERACNIVKRAIAANNIGGNCFWIAGQSGQGKTTIARIIARQIADEHSIFEFDSADQFGQQAFDDLSDGLCYRGFGKGGKAYIINEAHGLRKPIIRQFLGIIERLPQWVTIIFTTTKDGQEDLFEENLDANPFLSRCTKINLTGQGLAKVFAERALEIARAENLDGQPIESYVKLVQKCKNNFRDVLQNIQDGVMLV